MGLKRSLVCYARMNSLSLLVASCFTDFIANDLCDYCECIVAI